MERKRWVTSTDHLLPDGHHIHWFDYREAGNFQDRTGREQQPSLVPHYHVSFVRVGDHDIRLLSNTTFGPGPHQHIVEVDDLGEESDDAS